MLIVLIPCQSKMRTSLFHLSWPILLLSPRHTLLQHVHFNLQAQSPGSYEVMIEKQLSPIQSLMFPMNLWLFKEIAYIYRINIFPLIFFFQFCRHFIWLHPLAHFASVRCFPGHLWTLISKSKVGGGDGNNSTWKWTGDCLPPGVVMEGLSERAPPDPPSVVAD